MRPATPQRTSAPRLPTPEPRIEPVATWVVDSAMPRWLEDRMIAAEAVSAAIPCGEWISTRPLPRVRITRQPPDPGAGGDRDSAGTFTQKGIESVLVQLPYAIRDRVMTPIVFCASLVPWASETSEAEPI